MCFGAGTLDEQGARPRSDFGPRLIRDKRYNAWVSINRKIARLHNSAADPPEKESRLGRNEQEHQQALARFTQTVDSLPRKDSHPLYVPRGPNPSDRGRQESIERLNYFYATSKPHAHFTSVIR